MAEAENIIPVHLDEKSTISNYILRVLRQLFVGLTDSAGVTDDIKVELVGPKNGGVDSTE